MVVQQVISTIMVPVKNAQVTVRSAQVLTSVPVVEITTFWTEESARAHVPPVNLRIRPTKSVTLALSLV